MVIFFREQFQCLLWFYRRAYYIIIQKAVYSVGVVAGHHRLNNHDLLAARGEIFPGGLCAFWLSYACDLFFFFSFFSFFLSSLIFYTVHGAGGAIRTPKTWDTINNKTKTVSKYNCIHAGKNDNERRVREGRRMSYAMTRKR